MRRDVQRRRRAASLTLIVCTVLVAASVVSLVSAAWRWASAPRAWAASEVPVAFWSWRAEAPSEEEFGSATEATGARELFLRAGQFDLTGGSVKRVRAVEGKMPRGAELHFVYNATRALLAGFERIDEKVMAAAVADAFRKDSERAGKEGATVRGLQLDFDSPTRLLAHYARTLRAVREQLPPQTKLSVTGLPTWMDSRELKDVLAEVDFWVPQFYGAELPARFEQAAPVSSPAAVARETERARKLGKPFYAGLAAYGHAMIYDEAGALVALRGDLDAARVARGEEFELVERRAFEPRGRGEEASDAARATEWRYVYRALAETTIEGTFVRTGERVVFVVPSGESLRASARAVRERAGEKLLGLLVFRLPTRGDRTTLNLRQIAAALADEPSEADVSLNASGPAASDSQAQLVLTATNAGATGTLYGEGALALTLRVPRGSVRGVAALEGFDSFETLCGGRVDVVDEGSAGGQVKVFNEVEGDAALRPCSAARAGFVRLKARGFASGEALTARLSVAGELPASLAAAVTMRVDDGRVWRRVSELKLAGAGR